jgi:hypothetical protein
MVYYICRLDFRHEIKPQRGKSSNANDTLMSYILLTLTIPIRVRLIKIISLFHIVGLRENYTEWDLEQL